MNDLLNLYHQKSIQEEPSFFAKAGSWAVEHWAILAMIGILLGMLAYIFIDLAKD